MTTHKNIDKICIIICIIALILTILFMNGSALGLQAADSVTAYEKKLFDDTKVHSIDIIINETDFEDMLANASDKEYVSCTAVIDGQSYKNVAIRTKGNTSLSGVSSMGSSRYSFKIEFDHYDNNSTYYGLDKLSLNNIYQDATYLKDYLSYHMMNAMGIAAPQPL